MLLIVFNGQVTVLSFSHRPNMPTIDRRKFLPEVTLTPTSSAALIEWIVQINKESVL